MKEVLSYNIGKDLTDNLVENCYAYIVRKDREGNQFLGISHRCWIYVYHKYPYITADHYTFVAF